MNKQEHIKALKRDRDIQIARLPKQRQMGAMSKSIFGERDMFGNTWEQDISRTEKAILNYIKVLDDKIAKLEEEI